MTRLSIDCETGGLDLYHGALPFFVTTCMEDGTQKFWEWSVDPLTRKPQIPEEDVDEIRRLVYGLSTCENQKGGAGRQNGKIQEAVAGCSVFKNLSLTTGVTASKNLTKDAGRSIRGNQHGITGPTLIGQNWKFDATALCQIGIDPWPWERTHDTLMAAHLLASNQPHDLTALSIQYLGQDIEPLETALKKTTEECRRYCRSHLPEWRIAKKGHEEMPSAKEKVWKSDTWLPRALAQELALPDDHPWWMVLQEYANTDSATTLAVWLEMEIQLHRRGLWEVYLERLKVLPIAYRMERHGVTIHKPSLENKRREYRTELARCNNICVNVAQSLGYELDMPRGGNNDSLRVFCFGSKDEEGRFGRQDKGPLALPVIARTDTGNPCLDKTVIEEYLATLPTTSPQYLFIKNLANSRKLATALSYLDSYEKFWLPLMVEGTDGKYVAVPNWYLLHPNLNVTGTDTTRWSSQNPNSQNISKKEDFNLRECFGPAPGRIWLSMDYENLELKIPAYECGEQSMIELFERPNDPPYYGSKHLLVFDTLHPEKFAKHGKECKDVYASTWYQWVKNMNFAIAYGCQEAKADATAHVKGAFRKIKQLFHKQEALNQAQIKFAEKYGYVETMVERGLGLKKGYPLLCTRTEYGRILPTVPLSYHVQGTAVRCTERAMVRCQAQCDEWTREDPRGYYTEMNIHDELVFDLPADCDDLYDKAMTLKRLMEQSGDDIGVPLSVSVKYHPKNWGKSEKLPAPVPRPDIIVE